MPGAPIKRSRRGGFDLRIPARERDVLATLPDMLRALLVDGDAKDPVLQRLYLNAFTDDDEASTEFREIVHDDQLEQRLAAIDTMERTPAIGSCDRGRADRVARRAERRVRLVLGVRLAVTEEATPADFAGDPETEGAFELYRYLSFLEEYVVEALSS